MLVDTSYLVALIDPRDALHERALELARKLRTDEALLLTGDVVILELCGYFARGPLHGEAALWVDSLRHASGWEIVGVEPRLLRRAEERYRRHSDKAWSLVDCFLMVVLDERGLEDVATSDHHFEGAGYRALLR